MITSEAVIDFPHVERKYTGTKALHDEMAAFEAFRKALATEAVNGSNVELVLLPQRNPADPQL